MDELTKMISRTRYEKIEKEYLLPVPRPPKRKTLKLGGNKAPSSLPLPRNLQALPRKRSSSWRIKRRVKTTVKLLLSPRTLLKRMRDCYVNLMLNFANKRSNLGMLSSTGSISRGFGASGKLQMSNKDLHRLYMAYLQKTIDENKTILNL